MRDSSEPAASQQRASSEPAASQQRDSKATRVSRVTANSGESVCEDGGGGEDRTRPDPRQPKSGRSRETTPDKSKTTTLLEPDNPGPKTREETPTKTRRGRHAVIKTGHDAKHDDQEQARRKTAARHATDTRPRTEAQARPGRTHPVGKQHQHKPSGIPTSRRESSQVITSRHESSRVSTRHHESPQVLHESPRARTRTNETPASRRVSTCGHKPHKASRVSPRNPRHESQNCMNPLQAPASRSEPPQDNHESTQTSPRSPRGTSQSPRAPHESPRVTTNRHKTPPRPTREGKRERTRREQKDATSRDPDLRRDEDELTK